MPRLADYVELRMAELSTCECFPVRSSRTDAGRIALATIRVSSGMSSRQRFGGTEVRPIWRSIERIARASRNDSLTGLRSCRQDVRSGW